MMKRETLFCDWCSNEVDRLYQIKWDAQSTSMPHHRKYELCDKCAKEFIDTTEELIQLKSWKKP